MIGIYKITSPSGKIYIGESININRRWKKYKRLDCKGQHKLYNSFNKYGVLKHVFKIIEECSFNNLYIRERYWQEYYKAVELGNNCLYTNTKYKKAIFSKIIRDKMSKNNTSKRKIIQFSLNEKFIKEWESITLASKELNIIKSSIQKVVLGNRKKAGNFRWVYKEKYNNKYKFKSLISNKIKSVEQLDLKNNLIKTYPSLISVELDGFSSKSVSAVCNNYYNTHLGFKWMFKFAQ